MKANWATVVMVLGSLSIAALLFFLKHPEAAAAVLAVTLPIVGQMKKALARKLPPQKPFTYWRRGDDDRGGLH